MVDRTQSVDELLSPQHLKMLREESGISDDAIIARGYRTVPKTQAGTEELMNLGFKAYQCRRPGLLIPLHTTDGRIGLHVYRPDAPRVRENKRKKLPDGTYPCVTVKYELPSGSGTRVDCPPICQPKLKDPGTALFVTEGIKKGDALACRGLCAIALLGVWSWRGKNELGGTTVLADFDEIAFDNRDVRIVFDSDVMTKSQVRQALKRFTEHLQRKGANVSHVHLPGGKNGKVGVDDWLAAGNTVADLEALVEGPRPEIKAAPAVVELLDEPPPVIRRPLALIDGLAYAAAWIPTRTTRSESVNKKGEVVKHNPPLVTSETRLFIVRGSDGAIFGDGADKPIDDLGIDVYLPEMPEPSRTWSTQGVKAYRAGERPDPTDVFVRVADVVDRFIDFNRSLGDQRTMAEMIACYILGTWFLEAFRIVGFLWPNGDRGSGKTVLLSVVAEMGYLGRVILAGGSYASLRDLADYGACLCFDDAENLSSPRRSDPDKRALLLAGNRRGNTVPVKEPAGNHTWRTRHVSTFCPRLFSAIELPDFVLASRTVVVPLIRTVDRKKANSDPLDYEEWPHGRHQLLDDLWAVGLSRLPELTEHERAVGAEARLTGRNLEPWRVVLAVAHWLDPLDTDARLRRNFQRKNGEGVEQEAEGGLWERIEELSYRYQDERPDLETNDLTVLVIRALCKCATSATSATSATNGEDGTVFVFESKKVREAAVQIADDEDIDAESITPTRVGLTLGKLRLEKAPRAGGKGSRRWKVTVGDLERNAKAYGIRLPKNPPFRSDGGTGGISGTGGTLCSDDGASPSGADVDAAWAEVLEYDGDTVTWKM